MTFLTALAATASAPAGAATIVQNFFGPGSYTVDKFDPSLGTLNSITANVTGGSATYLVKLNGPLFASTTYGATAYFGIYLGPLTIDGNVQGAGTAVFDLGATEITLPVVPYTVNIGVPTDPNSSFYNALIGSGGTFSSLAVDPPFNLVFGDLGGRFVNDVSITSKSAAWSLEYDYTPLRPVVPEPATWAMMIVGFGAIGGAMRRRPAVASMRPA
ncbi:PEPxxWA-CTERM sorting domain-containing protein [uncultured Sphingomonas sp.]|uniref:PEPxxWA-CTERM sorting domain-containing protein n=1 Tax=uncultured Sphingomonas sp. TaxID=158754 RepID=UPI0035CC11C3